MGAVAAGAGADFPTQPVKLVVPWPAEIVHDACKKAVEEPQSLALLEKYDQAASYLGPGEYTSFVKQQVAEQKTMIEKLGLKAE
jgi:tripartite-type tricarboxylate transporter receptor subunit TctC